MSLPGFPDEWPAWLASWWIAIALFVLVWLAVTGLLASLGGWVRLASRFAGTPMLEGEHFRFVSGALGHRKFPVKYNGALFVHLSPEGLGLSIFFPFRFRSPPLLIPWSDIRATTPRRVLWIPVVTFEIQDCWPCISLQGRAALRAQQWFESARQGRAPDGVKARAVRWGI